MDAPGPSHGEGEALEGSLRNSHCRVRVNVVGQKPDQGEAEPQEVGQGLNRSGGET